MTNLRNGSGDAHARAFFITGLCVLCLFALLILRLAHIQLLEGERYRRLSERNRIRLLEIHAPRGKILDVNRESLADNRPRFDVTAIPEEVQDFDALEQALSPRSPLPPDTFRRRIQEMQKAVPFRSFPLWRDASWETMAYLEANRLRIPGVFVQVNQSRDYLYGDLLAGVIGYMGEISAAHLERDQGKHYRMGDWVGKVGIEKIMEEHLRGQKGGRQVEVDARGRQIRILQEREPDPGSNVVLHLDRRLQEAAANALKGQAGTVIAMDPRDGKILCYVNRPSFDPNLFIRGISLDAWRALQNDPGRPLTNRGIQGQYPPGSVFKVLVALAALETGVVHPEERIFCSGSHKLGNHTFHCWNRRGHGPMDLHQALVESCDVYFYQVGQRLGIHRIREYAEAYGLGTRTGIRIPGEQAGLVPSPEWKQAAQNAPWYEGETLIVAIGQGALLVTPLQMAVMISAVANGGQLWTPRLVKQVEHPDGRVVMRSSPERRATLPVSPRVLDRIHHALRDTVHAERGTGHRARIPGTEIAGKTGTAQVVRLREFNVPQEELPWEHRHHAWFVCYAPVRAPEIAVAVLVEHGGGGGSTAAPVAKKVLEAYFALKGEEEPRESGTLPGASDHAGERMHPGTKRGSFGAAGPPQSLTFADPGQGRARYGPTGLDER